MIGTTDAGLARPVGLGFAVGLLFFGGFIGWAAVAPLDSAALAPGWVSAESNTKTIQHLEGGIVRRILARDGDRVLAGQTIVHLDGTQANARLALLKRRQTIELARRARLLAERSGQAVIDFPERLQADASDPDISQLLTGQLRLFQSRAQSREYQIAILGQQVKQLEAEIDGLEALISAEVDQMVLIADEISDVRQLLDKGLTQRPRLRALQREEASLRGSQARNRARIAQARQSIGESRLQMHEVETNFQQEVEAELREADSALGDAVERIAAAEDMLQRLTIRSPITGMVVNSKIYTIGGVVGPGEPIMEIVPNQEKLVVDARLDPMDIDVVRVGLPARVQFSALGQRNAEPLSGVVKTVSADSLTDENSGQTYFAVRIEIPDGEWDKLKGTRLQAGMQADAFIVTGERTALDYFLDPLLNSFARSMMEN